MLCLVSILFYFIIFNLYLPCVKAGDDAKESPFDAIHDTEAFVAANDDMVAVVFRGTKEKADWAANLNACRRDCPESWGGDPGALHEVR